MNRTRAVHLPGARGAAKPPSAASRREGASLAVLSRAARPLASRSKYRNVVKVVDGIRFDSKLEARQYAELKLREKAGEVMNIICHHPLPLRVDGVRIGYYVVDFWYQEASHPKEFKGYVRQWNAIAQEAKGKMTQLAAWKIRHAIAEYKNVEFRIVKKKK